MDSNESVFAVFTANTRRHTNILKPHLCRYKDLMILMRLNASEHFDGSCGFLIFNGLKLYLHQLSQAHALVLLTNWTRDCQILQILCCKKISTPLFIDCIAQCCNLAAIAVCMCELIDRVVIKTINVQLYLSHKNIWLENGRKFADLIELVFANNLLICCPVVTMLAPLFDANRIEFPRSIKLRIQFLQADKSGAYQQMYNAQQHISRTPANVHSSSLLCMNIEYSNYQLSISFPAGLPTISTRHCSELRFYRSIYSSSQWFFPAPCFSARPSVCACVRAFSRTAYISA